MRYRIRFDDHDAGTIVQEGDKWYAWSEITKQRVMFWERSEALMYVFEAWCEAQTPPWDEQA